MHQSLTTASAPGTINAVKFVKGPHIPSEAIGNHFHHVGGNTLLDFVTPANTIRDHDTSLSALDLEDLQWRTLADGEDVFVSATYRWHYLAISPDQSTAYLLGCPSDSSENEYLSDVLPIDLRRYGIVPEKKDGEMGALGSLGFDLSSMFDDPSTSDFSVTAINDSGSAGDDDEASWASVSRPMSMSNISQQSLSSSSNTASQSLATSPTIHVHKLILRARWPHFNRLYNARMSEFHSGKLYIPEPFSVVKAFLHYLYTDSIAPSIHCPSISTVAGLLVLSNVYNLPQLRTLSLARITKEMNVSSVAVVWERAGVAGEEGLKSKAAKYCMLHWGRVVRTEGFRKLSKRSLLELCEEVDIEGRILNENELEAVGGLAGGKILQTASLKRSRAPSVDQSVFPSDDLDGDDDEAEEGMELS